MAEIKFYGNVIGVNGVPEEIPHLLGSGLGFFGAGFGVSVPVQSQQSTTWITNSSGTVVGTQLQNTAMLTSGNSTQNGQVKAKDGNVLSLNNLPNNQCPLNIRFTHTQPVSVKNCKLRVFDRNDIAKQASGVSTWIYETRHPATNQLVGSLSLRANSEYSWRLFTGGQIMSDFSLTSSPGVSGKNTLSGESNQSTLGWEFNEGDTHTALRHDWYLAISSEPDTPGAKQNYGLYFTLEYL